MINKTEIETIINFIEWLEDRKNISLTEEGDWPEHHFGDTYKSQLRKLIEEYTNE